MSTRRWRLALRLLVGLAAIVSTAALVAGLHDPSVASAHDSGDGDTWQMNTTDLGEPEVVWNAERSGDPDAHEHPLERAGGEWTSVRSADVDWLGYPVWNGIKDANPCQNKPSRSHCSYVVIHENPWEIDHDTATMNGERIDGDVFNSWCFDFGGPDPRSPRGPLEYNSTQPQHVNCADSTDPVSNPGRHGDNDLLRQHPYLADAGIRDNASPDQIVARGHHHKSHHWTSDYGNRITGWHAQIAGPMADELSHGHVKGFGAHWTAGGTHCQHFTNNRCGGSTESHETRTEHKTVMFWVWWEHAADEEPPEAEATFVPVVSIDVAATADGTTFGGTEFGVSFRPLRDGCSAAVSRVYELEFDVTTRVYVTRAPSPDVALARSTAGGQRCRYAVEFPAEVVVGAFALARTTVVGSPVSETRPQVSATYSVRALTFQPDVTISVPLGTPNSARFGVSFRAAGDAAGCSSPVSPVFRAGRNVLAAGSVRPWLRAFDADGGVCAYRAEFPSPVSAGGVTLLLDRVAGSPVTVVDAQVDAVYAVTGDSFFEPDVQITVVGATTLEPFFVFFDPVAGSHAGCRSDDAVYRPGRQRLHREDRRGAGGEVELVDVPDGAGAARRCVYEVTFPADVPNTTLVRLAAGLDERTSNHTAAERRATARYGVPGCDDPRRRVDYGMTGSISRTARVDAPPSETWQATWQVESRECLAGFIVKTRRAFLRTADGFDASLQRRAGQLADAFTYPDILRTSANPAGTPRSNRNTDLRQLNEPWRHDVSTTATPVYAGPLPFREIIEVKPCKPHGSLVDYRCFDGVTLTTPWVCPNNTAHQYHSANPQHYDHLDSTDWRNPTINTFTAWTNLGQRISFTYTHDTWPNTLNVVTNHCAGNFTPEVTLHVPDGFRSGQDDETQIPVTFAKQNPQPGGHADCDATVDASVSRSYTPNATDGKPATPDDPPTLDGACVYDVNYPATAADGELLLVEPVDDPDTAAREDQVAADDPATTWDERATEATYEDDACPLPSSMPAWPVRTSRRIGLPALLGGTPPQQWEWDWDDTPPVAFNWNSEVDDRGFRVAAVVTSAKRKGRSRGSRRRGASAGASATRVGR